MNNSDTRKDTHVQLPSDNKQPQSAKAEPNVTQNTVPYWWIMRRRNQ